MGNGIEALKDLGALAEFAYEQGFHEMGYDPIAEVRAAYDHEKARAVQAELERDRLETAVRAYIEGHELALMRAEAAKEALAAARRECGVVKALLREWNPRLCARKPWPRVGTPSACGQCLGCRTLAVVGATVETSP